MAKVRIHKLDEVESYVRSVSITSGLNLSEDRLKPHFSEFRRLLNDAEMLNGLVTGKEFIHIGPVTTYTHTKASLDSKLG